MLKGKILDFLLIVIDFVISGTLICLFYSYLYTEFKFWGAYFKFFNLESLWTHLTILAFMVLRNFIEINLIRNTRKAMKIYKISSLFLIGLIILTSSIPNEHWIKFGISYAAAILLSKYLVLSVKEKYNQKKI